MSISYLGRARKPDLISILEILEIPYDVKFTIAQLVKIITDHENYDESYTKVLLDSIIEEKNENRIREQELAEKEKIRLQEIDEREKIRLHEIEEKEKIRLQEIIEREEQRKLDYELEKLKIEKGLNSNLSIEDTVSEPKISLKNILPKFDPSKNDVSLFLVMFERQARRAKIKKTDYVIELISLLPLEIIQIIARESEELADDYEYVKAMLLKRFKLSPEIFRQKFLQHQKSQEATWKDYAFELQNYLDEWTEGLKIYTFTELKQLLVVDQLKRKSSNDIKEQFIDKWPGLTKVDETVNLFDGFEEALVSNPRTRNFKMDKYRGGAIEKKKEEKKTEISLTEKRVTDAREKAFEKRVTFRCYECGSPTHARNKCPNLIKDKQSTSSLNSVFIGTMQSLDDYTLPGKVNGIETGILRDTGADMDICGSEFVCPKDFTGEKIWIRQSLSLDLVCLPVAKVELEGDFGVVKTKAAICGNHLDLNRYILGNQTAAIIRKNNGYEFFTNGKLKAIQTGGQMKETLTVKSSVRETDVASTHASNSDVAIVTSPDVSRPVEISEIDSTASDVTFLDITKVDFEKAQKNCADSKKDFEIKEDEVPLENNQTVSNRMFENKNRLLVEVHKSTDYAHSELVCEINLRTPEILLVKFWMNPEPETDYLTECMFRLINRLKPCKDFAIAKMEEFQTKRKKWYDRNAVQREIKPGDSVLVLETNRTNKLEVQCVGLGKVRKKISKTNFVVEIPEKKDRMQIYRVNMQKPKFPRPEHITVVCDVDDQNVLMDPDIEIPYLQNSSKLLDFREVKKNSGLEENLENFLIVKFLDMLSKYAEGISESKMLAGSEDYASPYLDDVAIFSDSWEDHLKHKNAELTELIKANLTIKPRESKVALKYVSYVVFILGEGVRKPLEVKIKCVKDFLTPKTKTQFQGFVRINWMIF